MARGTWGGDGDPSIFKVTYRFRLGNSICSTGYKLRDVAIQDNTAQEVAEQVRTVATESFRALLTQFDNFDGVDVVKMGSEEGGWAPLAVTGGAFPNADADAMPNFICANVAMKSEIRKRYGQGRMFVPVVGEFDVLKNVLRPEGIARIQTWLDTLIANFMGNPATHDLIMVTAHPLLPARGIAGQPIFRAAIPASWYDVQSLRVNPNITFLRSRKVGVGS